MSGMTGSDLDVITSRANMLIGCPTGLTPGVSSAISITRTVQRIVTDRAVNYAPQTPETAERHRLMLIRGMAGGKGIMTTRYITPRLLERTLREHLRRAGYPGAVAAKGTRYIRERGRDCLQVGFYQYGTVLMTPEILKGYAGVLGALPGVVRTQIIHAAGKDGVANPLRDQVIVTHLRLWNEPDTEA